jgi:GxxExxY protein
MESKGKKKIIKCIDYQNLNINNEDKSISLEINKINEKKTHESSQEYKDTDHTIFKNINADDIEFILKVKGICEDIFNKIGTGYSEYIYHRSLEVGLRKNNINYESKKIIPVFYEDINVGYGEADIVLKNDKQEIIVIELKATTYSPREVEFAQVRTYLNTLKSKLGFIINFPQPGAKTCRETIDFEIVNLLKK